MHSDVVTPSVGDSLMVSGAAAPTGDVDGVESMLAWTLSTFADHWASSVRVGLPPYGPVNERTVVGTPDAAVDTETETDPDMPSMAPVSETDSVGYEGNKTADVEGHVPAPYVRN